MTERFGGGPVPAPIEASSPPVAKKRDAATETRIRVMVGDHFDFIWRCLRGLGVSHGSADDAAQQVFWIAAQKIEDITPGSERSFLFATARGVAANARRSQGRSRELYDDDALSAGVDEAANPEQELATKQARAALDKIFEALTPDLRTVFVLFELEGLSTTQIGDVLELPAGTVASRLRRAREEFQAEVKRFRAREGRRS